MRVGVGVSFAKQRESFCCASGGLMGEPQMKRDKIKHDDSKTGLSKMKTYFRQHMAGQRGVSFIASKQTN